MRTLEDVRCVIITHAVIHLIYYPTCLIVTYIIVVHDRPTNALISFRVYSLSYLLLHVSALSVPSSGSLHVPTELLVPSESLFIKFCNMNKMTLNIH
jgi:hypothetical protein